MMPIHVGLSINISAIYIALAGLFFVLLSLDMIRGRWKYPEDTGQNVNQKAGQSGLESVSGEGHQFRRAKIHATASEYFPIALLLLVAVENIVAIDWVTHVLGILLLVSRFNHAVGLRFSPGETLPRMLGAVGTLTMISVAAILVLINSF